MLCQVGIPKTQLYKVLEGGNLELVEEKVKDAGTYVEKVDVIVYKDNTNLDNYDITIVEGEFIIEQRKIHIQPKGKVIVYDGTPYEYPYNDTPNYHLKHYDPEHGNYAVAENDVLEISKIVYNKDGQEYNEAVDYGYYFIIIKEVLINGSSDTSNYNIIYIDGELTIGKIPVTATLKSNGTEILIE